MYSVYEELKKAFYEKKGLFNTSHHIGCENDSYDCSDDDFTLYDDDDSDCFCG